MQTFEYILLAVSTIWLWGYKRDEIITYLPEGEVGRLYKNKLCYYMGEYKPFNCDTCLTVWVGIILFTINIVFNHNINIIFLSLPLIYSLIMDLKSKLL